MARQYHFQFPSDEAALRFVVLVVQSEREVAICRTGPTIILVDGGAADRGRHLLGLALRLSGSEPPPAPT
jgi:hypothetical protein